MTESIKAAKHFEVEKWSRLKHAAMTLLMQETEMDSSFWDLNLIQKISKRFQLGTAFAFYSRNPKLWYV